MSKVFNPFLVRSRKEQVTLPGGPEEIKQDPEVMIVQGQEVDSKEEYFVSQALEKLDLDYDYQYSVFGGRERRGGQVLDFLVYTPGKWTVVDVRGRYWHRGGRESDLQMEKVIRQKHWLYVKISDEQALDVDHALTYLRANLVHG